MTAPFSAYRIDNRTNREILDPDAADERLAALAGRDDLSARGERVALLRNLGRLTEAEREGSAAYELARREGTPRQRVAALLRLAHVRQFQRHWNAADEMFREALARAGELDDPLMLAFAHQHAGRNHVDQGRQLAAVAAFRTALELREAHGAPADQLESTRGALRAAEHRLAGAALLLRYPGATRSEIAPAVERLGATMPVVAATADGQASEPAGGLRVEAAFDYRQVDPADFRCVLVPAGEPGPGPTDPLWHEFLRATVEGRVVVAAIGGGVRVLAESGVLDGCRTADDKPGAAAVVHDGTVVTAQPQASVEFARTVAELLGVPRLGVPRVAAG